MISGYKKIWIFIPISYFITSYVPKIKIIRKELFKFICNSQIKSAEPKHVYVEHPVFERDIRNCIRDESGGVKIIWAPRGTGKTTIVKHVLNGEIIDDQISGILWFTSPSSSSIKPAEWFINQLKYLGIETMTKYDHISSFIDAPANKPYVIVLDQCDNFDFDVNLWRFIKVMAEDSHLTKNYVVIVICSDASKVANMKEWNGGVKINLINCDFIEYKWNATQIEKWIEHHLKDHETIHPDKDIEHYNKFKKAAIVAGTPDFLITNSYSIEHKTKQEIVNSWNDNSKYIRTMWNSGQQLLSSRYCQSYWCWR
jgi:Cdc6-like AAA superfamily ATPase